MTDIRATVRDFILTECLPGEAPENLTDDMELRQSGILDSMKTLKLVSTIENATGLTLEAHEIDDQNFASVDAIVDFVDARQAAR